MIEKCRICGETPSIADVGGNNPYYEIICCCQSAGAKSKEGAIFVWNEMQKEGADNESERLSEPVEEAR